MDAKQCDRCKKYYNKNKYKLKCSNNNFEFRSLRIYLENGCGIDSDLCDECVEELVEFLNYKKSN